MIKIKRGLDLPISGSPKQEIEGRPEIRQVALVGYDYPGLKPTMAVREGDRVKAGQLVFTDKKT
ncbi:MAG: NADH:ubiquinone reductase (Na(+)-transporting) subunit A, partial [Gammaproteobacteria bacterium]|nr:NADH:ubiquinone reductase (Na(+)-transporting) subunit A [Gammaproteobacteria bacterium]